MKRNGFVAAVLSMCLVFGTVEMPVQAAPKGGFAATEEGVKWQNSDGTWAVNTWTVSYTHLRAHETSV